MENKNQEEIPRRKENRVAISGEPNLSKYKLIKTIGQGSFAKVKLARHSSTNTEVAIKIIDRAQLSADHFKKLKREIDLMKRLVHPNVIQLFEVIEDKKYIYLVMEYACGGEIFDYLVVNGRMKEKEARFKFRQILSAVQYCHQKGVVHRDLKAENLLLEGSEGVKLVDFGFANEYKPGCLLETFCGSPPYAAPELFMGIKYDGPKVDIWSLGVILYTLVSGSLPFDGSNIRELKEKVLRCRYRIPFFMSNECESLLKKMLVFNPKARSPLEEIMKHKWVNMGFESCVLKPYQEDPVDKVDNMRIEMMVNMGFSKEEVVKSVSEKKFDNSYATYMLLNRYSSAGSNNKPAKRLSNESCEGIVSTPPGQMIEHSEVNQKGSSPEPAPTGNVGMFGKLFNAVSSTVGHVMKFINPDSQLHTRRSSVDTASRSESRRSISKVGTVINAVDLLPGSKSESIKQRPRLNQPNPVSRRHTVSNRPSVILTPVAPLPVQTKRRLYTSNKKPRQAAYKGITRDHRKLESIPGTETKLESKKSHSLTDLSSKVDPSNVSAKQQTVTNTNIPTVIQAPIIEEIIKDPPKLYLQTSDSAPYKNAV